MSEGTSPGRGVRLREVAAFFLRLGCTAFGGPAVHIGMMEEEVVARRGWLTRQHFLDLVGATNLIPGPNSTEMTMHIGYERAGGRGLLVAGACFILPAAVLVGVLAWAYTRYGAVPAVGPWLTGIKPAVLAIIAGALGRLGRTAVKGARHAALGALVLAATLAGANEALALLAGGLGGMLWFRVAAGRSPGAAGGGLALLPLVLSTAPAAGAAAAGAAAVAVPVSLTKLGLFFLKVGAVLYGSGYVLVAFLQGDLVERYRWLTQSQLLDAIAIGQLTPGPLLCTATFIGYLVAGAPGAAVSTLAIFLPSFVFVWLLNPVIPQLRQSAWAGAFLDAVNVAAVALMLAVTIRLGMAALADWRGWVIAVAAVVAVLRFRVKTVLLVLGGAGLGWLLAQLPGP